MALASTPLHEVFITKLYQAKGVQRWITYLSHSICTCTIIMSTELNIWSIKFLYELDTISFSSPSNYKRTFTWKVTEKQKWASGGAGRADSGNQGQKQKGPWSPGESPAPGRGEGTAGGPGPPGRACLKLLSQQTAPDFTWSPVVFWAL